MSRTKDLKSSGICANLVEKDGKYCCPGHPASNKSKDYRNLDPDCEKDFVCKTYGLFQGWDDIKKKKFLKLKKFDNFTYSIRMDNDSILTEFEKNSGEKI